jgi:hypothetical protein
MDYPLMSNRWFPPLMLVLMFIEFLSFLVLFYVAQKKLRIVEMHLNKCAWINDTRRIWGSSGMSGKIHRISIIYSIYLFPTFWHKKKLIDLEQVVSLPKDLRLWIQVSYTTMLAPAVVMTLTYLWVNYL